MKPKFEIGQKVKFVNDNDSEAGKVMSFSFSPDRGFVYQISSKEVDLAKKEIINGVKSCAESELVAVKEK